MEHQAPRECIVFDIETVPHPELEERTGIGKKVAAVDSILSRHDTRQAELTEAKVPKKDHKDSLRKYVDELLDVADKWGVACGKMANAEPIAKKIRDHLRSLVEKAAVKTHGAVVRSIAMRSLRGVDEDLNHWFTTGEVPGPADWPGYVYHTSGETMHHEGVNERDVIEGFFASLVELYGDNLMLAGFNIRGNRPGRKGFDIPMLRCRSVCLGLGWPEWLPSTLAEDRYHKNRTFDVCDVFPEGSMDDILVAMGLPAKTSKGSSVSEMSDDQVAAYNANDVDLERLQIGMCILHSQPMLAHLCYEHSRS